MPIKTKRWNDPQEPDDGMRVLICRFRPRALPKKGETWDLWWPDLGPSKELHAAFYGKKEPPIPLADYERRFLDEMKDQEDRLTVLAEEVAAGKTVTLLCSSACTDAARCHRTLLRRLIEERVARMPAAADAAAQPTSPPETPS